MSWTDGAITVGLCITLAAAAVMFRLVFIRWRRLQEPRLPRNRLEDIGEIGCQVALWGGIAIMQFANLMEHTRDKTASWLSVAGAASVLLILGVHLGRMHMRWQLRALHGTIDGASGEILPHGLD